MTGVLLALAAACSWAATAICVRKGLRGFDPALGTLVSLVVGAAVLWSGVLLTPMRAEVAASTPYIGWFVLLSVLQFPLGRYSIYRCISIVGVPLGTAIHATSPLFATLFAIGLLGERVTAARAGGILLVVAGLAAMTLERRSVERIARRLAPVPGSGDGDDSPAPPAPDGPPASRLRAGVVLGVVGACAYGLTQVGARELASMGAHPMMTTAFTLAFGCLSLAFIARRSLTTIVRVDRRQIAWLSLAGLFAATGAWSLFTALSVAPVTLVSPVAAINPLIAMVIARFALRDVDVISRRMVGRAAVVVAGIVLVVAT